LKKKQEQVPRVKHDRPICEKCQASSIKVRPDGSYSKIADAIFSHSRIADATFSCLEDCGDNLLITFPSLRFGKGYRATGAGMTARWEERSD